MPGHQIKGPGIPRTGQEYQDLIGIELLLTYFRDPESYSWVEIESQDSEMGSLDDVVAARSDGSFDVMQVKFTPDPEKYLLDWDWLLEKKPKGTSRLYKWATSLRRVAALGPIHSARLRTNRCPSADFNETLSGKRVEFRKLEKDVARRVVLELGSADGAEEFFSGFEFSHSEPFIDDLEQQLRGRIVPSYTDNSGWLLLRDQVTRWATRKDEPQPDGRIVHQHLVQIITKKRAQPIPQDFQVPAVYYPPSAEFNEGFVKRITEEQSPISILWGTPGRGKSTYLSYMLDKIAHADVPSIRHHYFLSLEDITADRYSFPDVAASLQEQISNRYPDAVRGLEETGDKLRDWIGACGRHFAKKNTRFIVVVDGLDHVWRELSDIAQMNHLFNYLLPPPSNVSIVVGTQRVPDRQLPFRLLNGATSDDWIEIPPMSEESVYAWISGQHEAGRVRLAEHDPSIKPTSELLGEIGTAFFEISHGHPLHLIYSFEELVRRGTQFTAEEIRLLPECPDGDIQKYYSSLWKRLSEQAKSAIHLIAGSDFYWPPAGIRRCVGPIEEIGHLLEHRRSGLVPFHGSVLAFARDESNHEASFAALLKRVIEWLDDEADEFRRWGWLWIMRARNGDATDLLQLTTRRWVVESLARGWPDSQIIKVLTEAEHIAFDSMDLSRTLQLRLLKTRMLNGPEFQIDDFADFHQAAIYCTTNYQQVDNLADAISTISAKEIRYLARTTAKVKPDVFDDCVNELRRRVNLWVRIRHRPPDEFVSLAEDYLSILALANDVDIDRALRFLRGFSNPDRLIRLFSDHLSRARRFGELVEIAKQCKLEKDPALQSYVENAMVLVGSLEGIDIAARYSDTKTEVGSLMSCWFHYHSETQLVRLMLPTVPPDIIRDHYPYGRNKDLEHFFEEVFFYTLAKALRGERASSLVPPREEQAPLRWIDGASQLLERTARKVAGGEYQLAFSTPYYAAQEIDAVPFGPPSDAEHSQYSAFKHALRRIAINLHCLKSPIGKSPKLRDDDLAAARSSDHWNEEVWFLEQVDLDLHILKAEHASEILTAAIQKESEQITPFNERAEKWLKLAHFALSYDPEKVAILLSRAADCIVGYGWRKDLSVIGVLEAVALVHESGGTKSANWISTLTPIIEKITEFTDGDETDHARSRLIYTVGRVDPDLLPLFYSHYIANDEFGYAHDALAAHCKLVDFSDESSIALARTFLDGKELLLLTEKADRGIKEAERLASDQVRYLGGLPLSREAMHGDKPDNGEEESRPDFKKFSPTEFSLLVEEASDLRVGYRQGRSLLKEWLLYWKEQGEGLTAIAAISSYFDSEENPYDAESLLDDVFEVSLELEGKTAAYKWLVRAHIHRHGWGRYWSSKEENLRRLDRAAEHYKDKWRDFIRDTSKQAKYWQKRGRGFTIGTDYLVYFLLKVGQLELASDITNTLVRAVVDEVADQPIPECKWLQ